MEDYDEDHLKGYVEINNVDLITEMVLQDRSDGKDTDVGVLIKGDRVWVCVNGISLLRCKGTLR